MVDARRYKIQLLNEIRASCGKPVFYCQKVLNLQVGELNEKFQIYSIIRVVSSAFSEL